MMHGIYLVTLIPIWLPLALYGAVTVMPIQWMRQHFEGVKHDVPWSANIGGAILVLVMIIAISILQRGVVLPWWMNSGFQTDVAAFSIVIGATWFTLDFNTQIADRYHHIVVAPLQIFCFVTLAPVIFVRGTKTEICAAVIFVAFFVFLFWVDVRRDDLNPRVVLHGMGLRFKNEPQWSPRSDKPDSLHRSPRSDKTDSILG